MSATDNKALTRHDLFILANGADGWTTQPNGRGWWMRMIGEIWRLRAKVRWQAQRILDLEAERYPGKPHKEASPPPPEETEAEELARMLPT